jgi:hypothetical protein
MEGNHPSDADLVRTALGGTTDQERSAASTTVADRYRLIVLRQCTSWCPYPDAAQEIGQAACKAAFTLLAQGNGPEQPDKLAHRDRPPARPGIHPQGKPAGVQWADSPEGRSLEGTEYDEDDR